VTRVRIGAVAAAAALAWSARADWNNVVPFIHADEVHANKITGRGVVVAVIDYGVHLDDPGLQGHIVPGGRTFRGGLPVGGQGGAGGLREIGGKRRIHHRDTETQRVQLLSFGP
jgi:hypothetical protein